MNPTSWFASLVTRPTIIDSEGFYITRCGELVEITNVSTKQDFGCTGRYLIEDITDRWHKSGRLYFGQECENDIVRKAAVRKDEDGTVFVD